LIWWSLLLWVRGGDGAGFRQTELLDRRSWATRRQLRIAVFDYLEASYNRRRRHSALGYLSPANYEKMTAAAPAA
jgi:putative transposase